MVFSMWTDGSRHRPPNLQEATKHFREVPRWIFDGDGGGKHRDDNAKNLSDCIAAGQKGSTDVSETM